MKTKPIRVLQLNTNRSNHVCHTLLNDYINRFDIILMTEPWWDRIGGGNTGPVSHHAWSPILPVGTVNAGQRPRVLAYTKRSRTDFTVTLRSDVAQDLDIQVLDVHQHPNPTTTLVNIYSQPRSSSTVIRRRADAAKRLRSLPLPRDNPVIISGDWNNICKK
ncbi:hypothetical protein PLICRDRAFT_45468 [Plicaturopsis crispa FD-325 SS-3]|uniref:Endonuclease/exonuclease/phosphatase domain-containing protein n=1 Tax=Plicaturopsis crispa FD-325 SS-3 TaxID=944288 RepID=A0A0C9SYV4_PLICR|nr:hypothetical protein PLICRDRAFT_45468 [Plicaturopsis crispa FD-325 SS-3]